MQISVMCNATEQT